MYVFGAGFSADANFPLQAKLLSRLVEEVTTDAFSSFIPIDAVNGISEFMTGAQFLVNKKISGDIPLEDIFTLLDQAIATRASFASFSWKQLIEFRDNFV